MWQKTEEAIADYEDEMYAQEPIITDMPQGMVVQYIPNGLLIFGKQEDFRWRMVVVESVVEEVE